MLNFEGCVKNSDTAQPCVTNVKTPNHASPNVKTLVGSLTTVWARISNTAKISTLSLSCLGPNASTSGSFGISLQNPLSHVKQRKIAPFHVQFESTNQAKPSLI